METNYKPNVSNVLPIYDVNVDVNVDVDVDVDGYTSTTSSSNVNKAAKLL